MPAARPRAPAAPALAMSRTGDVIWNTANRTCERDVWGVYRLTPKGIDAALVPAAAKGR